jgi:hypothetical protein
LSGAQQLFQPPAPRLKLCLEPAVRFRLVRLTTTMEMPFGDRSDRSGGLATVSEQAWHGRCHQVTLYR